MVCLEGFSISCSKLHPSILFNSFSIIQLTPLGLFISYKFLSYLSHALLNHSFSSRIIFQSRTAHLYRLHYQCSDMCPSLTLTFSFSCRHGPSQDVTFFYTGSYFSELQTCTLIFSTNFNFIFIFK